MGDDIAQLGLKIDANGVLVATGALDKLTAAGGRAEGAASRITRAFGGLGLAIGGGLMFRSLLRESVQAQNAMAQLEAAVRATGGAAGRTVAQLTDMATALQRTTIYSDEAVMGAESLLLTFNKISGATFDRATRAVTDLAARMGGDLSGAAMQLGKALQEPATGLMMLRRAGLTFDEAQIQVIKHLAETGRLAEAQALILTELESRFRGSAEAARNTLGGALAGLRNAFGDTLEVSRDAMGGLIETVNAVASAFQWAGDVANRFFGGISLLAVDAAVAWAKLRNMIAGNPIAAGAVASLPFGLGALGSRLLGGQQFGQVRPSELNRDLEAWRREQYALITGTGRTGAGGGLGGGADGAATSAVKELTKSYKELAAAIAEKLHITRRAVEDSIRLHRAESDAIVAGVRLQLAGRENYVLAMNQEILDAQAAQSQGWFDVASESGEAMRTMLKDMQRGLSDFFEGLFTTGVASFRALFDAVRGMFARMLADLAAQRIRVGLEGLATGGGVNVAALGGGLTLGAIGIGATAALSAVGTALDSLFNGASNAARAQAAYNAALAAFNRSMTSFRNSVLGLGDEFDRAREQWTADVRALIAQMPGALALKGALSGFKDLFDLIEQGIARMKKEAEANRLREQIAGYTRTIDTLRDYAASLKLGPSSILNPMAQYAEARRQYDVVLAAAQGGDQAAAGRLPAAAQAFLDASRAVNASTEAYVRDVKAVEAAVEAVAAAFEAQRSIAQQSLDALLGIERNTATLPSWGTEGGSIPVEPRRRWDYGEGEVPDVIGPVLAAGFETVSAVSVAGFEEVVARLDSLTAQVVALTGQTRQTGENLAVT